MILLPPSPSLCPKNFFCLGSEVSSDLVLHCTGFAHTESCFVALMLFILGRPRAVQLFKMHILHKQDHPEKRACHMSLIKTALQTFAHCYLCSLDAP